MKVAAKFISIIFHPLLLATYLVLVIGIFFPVMFMVNIIQLLWLALIVFSFTFFLPALNIWLFKIWGNITSLQMESQEERKYPFVFISVLYVITVYLFYSKFSMFANLNKLMTIIAALVVMATVITFFMKVSVHSLAMCGWIGILLPLIKFSPALLVPTVVVIILSGLVISSRLFLNAHTLREAMIGSMAGFLVGYGGMILLF